jgi:hypothetical protein
MPTLDFNAAPTSRLPWGRLVIVGVIGLGLGLAMFVPKLQSDRAAAIAEAKAWTIDGPPCPQLSPVEAARWLYQPTKSFDYAGANIGYVFGHVACAQIHDDGGAALVRGHPVCQFTSPAVVAVETGRGKAFFTPGLGQRTTVSVQNGVARCVMDSRYDF